MKLKLRFKRGTREIVVSDDVLEMLSEPARKAVMDESVDDDQRFKVLLEELYWAKGMSTYKMAEKLNIKYQITLWRIMEKLNIRIRDTITAVQLANRGRYKYLKRDFDGGDAEKLKLWYLAHTDGSVWQYGQQVGVMLGTPDPYLVFLFKELFGRYGRVGLAPYRDDRGRYVWWLWVYLPLKSFQWLLEGKVPAPMDEGKLYDALSVAIDAEGMISAWKRTKARTTGFKVALYNEKGYVITPLYQALTRLGYNPRLGKVPKGRMTSYGHYNSDYHSFTIYKKASVKRLLETIELTLRHKSLKVYLIRHALSDPKELVYWEDIEPMYTEINMIHEEMLIESKCLTKALHLKWQAHRELWKSRRIGWKQYEEERARLEAEAWRALEKLKEKYDKVFSELEERIKARFRARKPQNKSLTTHKSV